MAKLHIKSGDTVYVNAGEDKGKTGKVLKVLVDKQRAIGEGVNFVTKSKKPSAQNPQGGIVKMEAPIHISNLNIGSVILNHGIWLHYIISNLTSKINILYFSSYIGCFFFIFSSSLAFRTRSSKLGMGVKMRW